MPKIRPRYRKPRLLNSAAPVARTGDNGLMRRCDPTTGTHVWRVHPEDGVACAGCGLPIRETLLTNDTAPRTRARTPYTNAGLPDAPTGHRIPWEVCRTNGWTHCYWCRQPFTADRPPTADHVIPVSEGGTRADGIVYCCQTCNGARGSCPFDEYRAACQAEHEACVRERREYRRPKVALVGDVRILTTATRRERRALVLRARAATRLEIDRVEHDRYPLRDATG